MKDPLPRLSRGNAIRTLALAWLCTKVFSTAAPAAFPPELPVEAFFAHPSVAQLALSPNGRYLAALMPANNRINLSVIDLQAGSRLRLTDMKDENVTDVRWKSDDRLIFRQQFKGQENFGIFAVDHDGRNLRILKDAVRLEGENAENQAKRTFTIIDYLDDDPDHILVNELRGSSGLGDVMRLNIRTERATRILNNLGKVREWLTDRAGVVRVAVSRDENEETATVLYRANEKSPWVELATHPADGPRWKPVAFEGDNRTLYVASNVGRATTALFTYDPETRQMGREVAAHPTYDVGDLFDLGQYNGSGPPLYSRKQRKVVGIPVNFARPELLWFGDEYRQLQADLDGVLPGTANRIVSTSADETKVLVRAGSDRDPGTYHLLDTRTMEMRRIGSVRPEIDPGQMAEMRPITYRARDGLLLHGYLTLPVGREAKKLPLVLHPHGGPYGPRDAWGFNPTVQFLANRGCAVLQVDFRGSGGYGHAFEAAGYNEWGLKMQDDLTDGVRWAIAEGIADPDRVAIFGASYGGYATLAGLVFTPELYRCGINNVGVTDLTRTDRYLNFGRLPRPLQKFMARRWGDPTTEKAKLEATSPVNFVERIQVPLLMAYGQYDPRVRIDQGEVLADRLKRQGKDFTNIVIENEGHGFAKLENRLRFYSEVDSFLKQHLLTPAAGNVKVGPARVIEMPAKR